LTFSRLAIAPIVGYCILHDINDWALGLFVYAGITDLLDGYIARRWNQQTVVGTVIDPMADKTLMTVLTVCFAIKGALPGELPCIALFITPRILRDTHFLLAWLAFIILGRDVGLAISAIYYRWISLPPPKSLARYWDFSLPSAEVRPTQISKYNTALQLALMGLTASAPLLTYDLASPLSLMQYVLLSKYANMVNDTNHHCYSYVVALTTIWSGASYVVGKDTVRILHSKGK
jgi:cardiolipin synthase (CMP-forming)